jgi:tRNA-specific 2-thiouridylase
MSARIVVAMSGGVDSSVAAGLLAEQGYDVIGISLKLWEHGDEGSQHGCCTPDDLRDARRVAERLAIPHYVFDMVEEFGARVVDGFVDEYLAGRTPNPCVACNDTVKFDTLLGRSRALGAEALATGHYARLEGDPPRLFRGVDADKDQSYFLYNLPPETLRYLRFPVGGISKVDVRRHAHRLGLPVADKPDSQEICFVPDRDHATFIEDRVAPTRLTPGVFKGPAGELLGRHSGIHRFTIGQRRGLGLGGLGSALGSDQSERVYVTGIDAESGEVRIGPAKELGSRGLKAKNVRWMGTAPGAGGAEVTVRVRHRHAGAPGVVRIDGDGGAIVEFRRAVRAVAPGQAVVFYEGDRVLGGGSITEALPASLAP